MSDYKCSQCGATGCKLWRNETRFDGKHPPQSQRGTLYCLPCAEEAEQSSLAWVSPGHISDKVGKMIPAIPVEDRDAFWSYFHAPAELCAWWRSLRTGSPRGAPSMDDVDLPGEIGGSASRKRVRQ